MSTRLCYLHVGMSSLISKFKSNQKIYHGNNNLLNENQFTVLRKCQGKFDCLVFEMLFIKNLKPNLNIQTDSIRAKVFV